MDNKMERVMLIRADLQKNVTWDPTWFTQKDENTQMVEVRFNHPEPLNNRSLIFNFIRPDGEVFYRIGDLTEENTSKVGVPIEALDQPGNGFVELVLVGDNREILTVNKLPEFFIKETATGRGLNLNLSSEDANDIRDLILRLEAAVKDGRELLPDLEEIVEEGSLLKTELEKLVNDGGILAINLSSLIDTGSGLQTTLAQTINLGISTEEDLKAAISLGNTLKGELETLIETGNNLVTSLTEKITEGNQVDITLGETIVEGKSVDESLREAIDNGDLVNYEKKLDRTQVGKVVRIGENDDIDYVEIPEMPQTLSIRGTWDASTNTVSGDPLNTSLTPGQAPDVEIGDGNGASYIVAVDGTWDSTEYNVGDMIYFNAHQSEWQRLPFSDVYIHVTSVNGKTGAVVINATDVGAVPSTGGNFTGNITIEGLNILRERTNSVGATADWNTFIEEGMYGVGVEDTSGWVDGPPGAYGYGVLCVFKNRTRGIAQVYFGHQDGQVFIRGGWNNGSFREWRNVANPHWDHVAGKPSSFPPSTHGHAWDEISEKPASYPPSSHGHTPSEAGLSNLSNNGNNIAGNFAGNGGTISGFAKVYNTVFTDYAELFEKGEEAEDGDIIILDINSDKEVYIKSKKECELGCVGVVSDEYAMLIGGEEPPEGVDVYEHNKKKYFPVGLAGRVRPKVKGIIKKGDFIVTSDTEGVGRAYIEGNDPVEAIIGMAVEKKTDEKIKRVRMLIRR